MFGRSLRQRRFQRLSESIDREYSHKEMDGDVIHPHILTEEEIMNKYWKLMVRIYKFSVTLAKYYNVKMYVKCAINICGHYRHPLRQSLMPFNDGSASRQAQ